MKTNKVEDQAAAWNGPAARGWIEAQTLLDRVFEPFEHLLAATVAHTGARHVLDVGCGTGATTIAAAQAAGGDATGIDISERMIDVARTRAARQQSGAKFICADAQTHSFPPNAIDLIISRFGVMFFSDPPQAFANLRKAAAPGAALRVLAWRSAAENPFMTAAESAAAPLLPNLPPRAPDGPGQFAFADGNRTAAIVSAGGWNDVSVRPLDVECVFPSTELPTYVTLMGPVGRVLQDADAATRSRIVDRILPAFDPFIDGATVRIIAACWDIQARRGAAD